MQCILCKTEGDEIQNQEGFRIFNCSKCKTHFGSLSEPADYSDYERLYPGIKGFCEDLRIKPNPWRRVADRGEPYKAIVGYFMNQNETLNILDVGCGYGYLVYALRKLGFDATGIDIVDEPIKFANNTFGEYFSERDVNEYGKKHDMIVAVEIFEHLANPREWLQRCLRIAPKVMITTPNLGFYKKDWVSEPPPIHLACYKKESLEWLANDLGVKVEIDDSGQNLIATFYES